MEQLLDDGSDNETANENSEMDEVGPEEEVPAEYTGTLQHQARRGSYRLSHEKGYLVMARSIVASMIDEDGADIDGDDGDGDNYDDYDEHEALALPQ
jgi:hypothetical protein